ncbi:MAG: YadA-like family protein [Veillonella atypica]
MNKIFKVIWSKSKQCYVVVSEIAKNTTGKKKIIVASILATLAMQTVSITNVQAINDTGTGTQGSVALGYDSQAKGTTVGGVVNPSVAVGTGSYAEGNSALALGTRSWAKGSYNVSVGREAKSSQDYGIAVGYQADVSAIHGMALGERAAASGQIAVAVGANAKATGANSFAGGFNSASGGTSSVALGESASSSGETSVAIGKNTVASGGDGVSIGTSSQATGGDSIALGKNAKASNGDTIAIGQDSVANLLNGVALGKTSKATGASATALGPQSTASATYATAIGMNSVANKDYAIAIGGGSEATVERGVALGTYSKADTASGVAGYNANANRTNKYAGLTGNTLTSTWGAVSIGDGTNTRQMTGLAAGTNDTDAVNVAQLKSVNLAFTGDNSSSGDVNLANSKLAVTGDTTYITTTAANQGITVKGVKKDITVSNGTASASVGMADAKNVAEAINQANADQTITYKANGGTANSVKLSDGLNFSDGTSTVATVGTNGQVTYDLNTATKKSITDSEAAVKRTISLGADSGTRSSQSLNSNNVAFNVKGHAGSYITTAMVGDTLTVNTTRGTIQSDAAGTASISGADGLATAQNVATAINKAREGAAWDLAVNSGAAQKVSGGNKVTFKDGKNISLTQSGTTITVGTTSQLTADNVTVGTGSNQIVLNGTTGEVSGKSIKVGNTTLNTNGLTISGGPSVTTTGINAGNTAITNVASGLSSDSNAATVGDVKSLVNGLGSNSFKLTADSTSTATQALNKSGGLSFKVAGDSDLISTSATGDTVKVSISKGSLTNNTDGTVNANKAGVATTGDVATAVNDAVAKATGAQGLTITDGTHNGKINLKTQSLAITGTNGVDATVNNQNLTVGLNTATKTAIDNAQTAVNRTISLGADSGTALSQSLKDGNVAFNVKGKTGDYITTAMNGSTVEISTTRATINSNATTGAASVTGADGLVTAKNVSDAINKAAEAAKSGAAWNLTTNSSTTDTTLVQGGDTVDLVNGDNIEISQDGTNKKKVTIKTKKDLTVDSIVANKSVTVGSGTNQISLDGTTGAVSGNTFAGNSFTAGNSVLNTTGFHITGGPSVTTAGIDAGNKAITNVASGLGDDSNAATVGDVKGLVDGVGKNTFTLTADTTSTTAQALNKSSGLSFKVAGDGNLVSTSATGDTVTVSVSQGSLTNNTDGTVNANKAGVATTGDVATAVNDAVAKATGSQGLTITDGANTGKVNLKTQSLNITGTNGVDATVNNQTVTVGLNTATKTAIDNAQTAVNRTISLGADSGTVSSQSLKDGNVAFNVKGKTGDYITTAMNGNTVEVSTQQATLSNNATTGAATVTGSDGLVTAKNVADTINAVADKIKTGAAWKLTTNSSATDATDVKSGDTVDLVNGDNIEISQDGTNKKKVTIKTKKDLTVDSIVANKSVTVGSGTNQISLDGTTGAVSGNTFAGNSFTAGNSVLNTTGFHITGGPSVTAAGIDAGNKAITNVASGGTTRSNAATVGDVQDAVANLSQNLNITDGTNNGTVDLKTQKLNVAGANGVTATVNNQTVTVGLDTATKTAIDNAQTAVNRTISLGADSGTVSSQSLKDGNVAFNVKGKTGDYITTAMNGNTVEISTQQATLSNNATTGDATVTGNDGLVTAKNVADTINAVADKIKTSSAWKLTTNSSTTDVTDVKSGDTVDLVNGDNIEISQDGTNKKKVTIKTKKDLMVDSIVANKSVTVGSGTNQISLDGTTGAVSGNTFAGNSFTAGSSVLNTTGFHITGGPSVTTAGIDAGNKAITNVASGLGNDSNAATVGDVKGLVDGVGKNTFTLTADTTSTTAQALNKSSGLSFKVAGDGNLVSTSATGSTVTVSVSQGSLTNNTDGTVNANKAGVATTGDVATAVNTAVAKATGAQALTITDGTTDGTINLKNEKLNVAGANGVTATVNNQTITVGLNTATKTAIDNAQTAVNRTISLGADSGTASSQSLKDGNVAFNVKGKTGDYITTAMNGSTVEISTTRATINSNATTGAASVTGADGLVTAKNVSDAINKAAEAAKSGAAWNLTTNSSTTDTTLVQGGDTVDLVNGDNIEISQDGTNKKKVTIKTKKDLTVDSIVANKSVTVGSGTNQISLDGTTGAVSGNTFAGNSFTAGNSVLNTTGFHITGGPSITAAGIDAGNKSITNVASGGTTRSNAATVGDVQDAVANLSQNLNITDGTNNGTVDLKTQKLNVAGANGVTATVNNQTITVGLDTNVVNATTKGIGLTGDTGATGNKYLKDGDVSFAIMGDGKLVTTSATATGVKVAVNTATITAGADGTITGPTTDGVATAKNVADAINAATAKAVSQSAWKLAADGTTGTETISGGDTVNFKAGTNMEVSRTGKDITYKTKEDVTFKTVTAGTGANEVKLDGNTGTVTAKDITATGDVTAKNVTTSGNVTAAGTVKGDTVQGNTVKAGNVTITGGTTNTIAGLSNTTWTGSTTTPDRAATEGQLQQAISSATSSATFKFDGDNNSQQTMNLQNGTFKVTGDTMITTNATSAGVGLSLNTNNVKIAYAANGTNGQTTSLASGFNFTNGDHTKATVDSNGVVKYNAQTSTISVANGHATASGNDLATADNVADAINQMTQSNAGNTAQLRQEISKVATETQRVGAHAAAMAALKPIQYDPLAPTQIMAGVGNYRGESAAALGIAHYTNDNTMFNVGVSVGGNHNMINAGVTHKFGISAEKKNIPDRYKAGPISSIYVMQDEMTQLRSENEAYKAKLDKQQSEIDTLKAAVDQLLASKA